ncbi:flagellar assembly peptidoglycan hydrolase FlgJ [Psychrobium sp. MM17-31]|uniref:flagellar assembly peptidoglycan hydrolase FlgJ n=1 Tax=Psychrobium sp. MM17-31 TaxID=2917758 RepID=UPI001EF589EA|nr:flagellar assembly peptidoglycan hydrolase FlgJ [Psychrobium sp. MM17-31]MCG7530126.1 flagellar assembly peptidoglycan hydrolase FlgJ [Psychrobium sp. MM17-31]
MDSFAQSLSRQLPTSQSNYQDIASLDKLRQEAQSDEKAALNKVAKQFEGIFMKMLLKSMREANKAFEADSPFNSQGTETYRNMHDDQMATELSESGSLGLAELIVQQLSPQTSGVTPASVLRTNNDLPMKAAKSSPVNRADNASVKTQAADNETAHFKSQQDFVEQMMPYAKKAAQVLGLSPQTMIAQAALETGWGQKIVGKDKGEFSFNLFNIKADKRWDGDSTEVSTIEYREGVPLKEKASFRRYQDFEQSFIDFGQFLKNSPRYEKALSKVENSASFLHELQQAGYATDPNYASKIMAVLKQVSKLAP